MPNAALAVNAERAADIDVILSLVDRQYDQIRSALHADDSVAIVHSDLEDRIRPFVGDVKADIILKLLLSLRRYMDRKGVSSGSVFDMLVEGARRFGFIEPKLEILLSRKGWFVTCLESHALYSSYKLLDLYYDMGNHLHDMSILTEMRPVFNQDRSKINGFIVYNCLRLTISDSSENESEFTITLEREELERMRDECERALKKTKVVVSEARERMNAPVFVFADSETIGQNA